MLNGTMSGPTGARDREDLRGGLKENVTMGRLIPAGTGFEWYRHVRIPADEPPPPPVPPQPTEDELNLDREIEYAFDTDSLPRRSA